MPVRFSLEMIQKLIQIDIPSGGIRFSGDFLGEIRGQTGTQRPSEMKINMDEQRAVLFNMDRSEEQQDRRSEDTAETAGRALESV